MHHCTLSLCRERLGAKRLQIDAQFVLSVECRLEHVQRLQEAACQAKSATTKCAKNPCNFFIPRSGIVYGSRGLERVAGPVGIALLAARLAPAKLSAGVERDALPVSGKLSSPQQQRDGRGSGRSSHHACCER